MLQLAVYAVTVRFDTPTSPSGEVTLGGDPWYQASKAPGDRIPVERVSSSEKWPRRARRRGVGVEWANK
jgi:hypothetical protein